MNNQDNPNTKKITKTEKTETDETINSEIELLKIYLEDLKSIPPADELLKKELMQAASSGKQEAKKQLAELYLMQAVQLAASYRGQGIGLADLIQEANIGLMEALSETPITEKKILSSIETALKQAITQENNASKIGNQLAERLNLLSDTAKKLASQRGKEPTIKELAEYLHITEEEVQNDLKLSLDVLSAADSYSKSKNT